MTTTLLERPTRVTPARGVIAPSLLKSAEQGGATAIRVGEDPYWSLPPAGRYLTDPGDPPPAPEPAPPRSLGHGRASEGLWRWFVVASLAAGYVLTGVAYFLG